MDHVDTIVVGGGIVGLAVARAISLQGQDVVILEKSATIGSGISSRNSEVIHAGIYYEPGTLKAKMCVKGNEMLYSFCEKRGIQHRQCGKLIVATRDEDVPKLHDIAGRGQANGVNDLKILTRSEAKRIEPVLNCKAVLMSPSSGIVDSHELMTTLLGDAENSGALLALNTQFLSALKIKNGGTANWQIRTGGDEKFEMSARWIINCAGLYAQHVASTIEGHPVDKIPQLSLVKGNYFSLAGKAPFSHLIYPMPEDGGLGVHLTLDLAGQARFGPDVEWLEHHNPDLIDYEVPESRAESFAESIRRYWPDLLADALQPAYSGVRPKLSRAGAPSADFRIDGPRRHGCPGVIHLFGIESPGLTACMAIAEMVAGMTSESERAC